MPEITLQPPARLGKWKRIAVIVLLLLVGGALVNVAVAWGCAAYSPASLRFDPAGWPSPELAKRIWDDSPLRRRPAEEFQPSYEMWNGGAIGGRLVAVRFYPLDRIAWKSGPIQYLHYMRADYGWPLPSMRGEVDAYMPPGHPQFIVLRGLKQTVYSAALEWPSTVNDDVTWWLQGERPIPLRPLLPSFMLNTLFYAVLLWLLVAPPWAMRRASRRRRGLCEKCAYPIGISHVCTECGAAVCR